MPAYLTLHSVAAQTPERRLLFEGLSLSLGTERIGLVGRNGSGKSTLLRIIAGQSDPAEGFVRRSGSIGFLMQDWPPELTVAEALGVAESLTILQCILSGKIDADNLDAIDWTLEPRLQAALSEVGLKEAELHRRMGSLSGGERTRVGIARVLIERNDFLLLDEPTNNLDTEGREAIYSLIRNWKGGVVVASHDRLLLEIVDRIVELSPIGVRIVGGGWSTFSALSDAERAKAAIELERSEKVLRNTERTAQRHRESKDRRDKAGRAFAAKRSQPKILLGMQAERAENSGGRAHIIDKRQTEEAAEKFRQARTKVEVLAPLVISMPATGVPPGMQLLSIENVSVVFGERSLGPWTLRIRGGERVAITGPNGAGKTTLLKIAAGAIAPTCGTVRRVEGRVGMLDQHITLLDHNISIAGNFLRLNPSLGEQDAYAACARFAFRNRDADQIVGNLSGGERLRAGLACILGGECPPWLLILDEPTNHLDVATVEILEEALRAYDGALIIVSHDRAFIEAIHVHRHFYVGPS